jgi:hypothetical protein
MTDYEIWKVVTAEPIDIYGCTTSGGQSTRGVTVLRPALNKATGSDLAFWGSNLGRRFSPFP